MTARTRRRLRSAAQEPAEEDDQSQRVVDLTLSDEEDSQPLAALVKQEHKSPPASPASRPRRHPSTASSSSSSQSGSQRRAQPAPPSHPNAKDADEKMGGGGGDGDAKEEKDASAEEKVDAADYSAHFNGVSYHQLSSVLTQLQHESAGVLKSMEGTSGLIESVLATLPPSLYAQVESSFDAMFFLEGRVKSEQAFALERAKELIVQGDVGHATDWETVMKDGWKDGHDERRAHEQDERRQLERRKAAIRNPNAVAVPEPEPASAPAPAGRVKREPRDR